MAFTEDDLDRLADYTVGALDPDDEAAVAVLIDTNPSWAAMYEQLTAADPVVGAWLRDEEPVAPMPADVVARIDTALGAVGRTPVVSLAEARRRRQRRGGLIALGALAAAVAAVVGGGFVAGGVSSQSKADSGAASAPRDANSATGENGYGGVGGAADAPPVAPSPTGPVVVVHTTNEYSYATLPLAVARTADEWLSTQKSTRSSAPGPVERAFAAFAAPDTLAACLHAVGAFVGGTPIRAEFASYEKKPAIVVVVTVTNGSVVAAVGPACGPGRPDIQALRPIS